MKKTSIYILSIIAIGVLLLSIIMPIERVVRLSIDAYNSGISGREQVDYDQEELKKDKNLRNIDGENGIEKADIEEKYTPIQVHFQPSTSTMLNPSDTIRFSNGRELPFILNNIVLLAPSNKIPKWVTWIFLILSPLQIVFLILIFWKLIRFIINVSKEHIFVTKNVKYLRQISTFLLCIALIQICEGLCQDKIFSIYNLTKAGYELNASWDFPWNSLIIGSLGFLFAQIWSYGIAIKQDQELTI